MKDSNIKKDLDLDFTNIDFEDLDIKGALESVKRKSLRSLYSSIFINGFILIYIGACFFFYNSFTASMKLVSWWLAISSIILVTCRFLAFCFFPLKMLNDVSILASSGIIKNIKIKKKLVIALYKNNYVKYFKVFLIGLKSVLDSPLLGCSVFIMKLFKTMIYVVSLFAIVLKFNTSRNNSIFEYFIASTLSFLFKDPKTILISDAENILISLSAYFIASGTIIFGLTLNSRIKDIKFHIDVALNYYISLIDMTTKMIDMNISLKQLFKGTFFKKDSNS